MSSEKKKIQVQIDKILAQEAERIFMKSNLDPTSAITAFFEYVVVKGGIPFELTEREKNDLAVRMTSKGSPIKKMNSKDEFQEWLDETSDRDEL